MNELQIRKDVSSYLSELRAWLSQTETTPLENMDDFFRSRIDAYEDHMSVWKDSYRTLAQSLPCDTREILDLGCGSGLELDEMLKRFPDARVCGIDLSQTMLDKLHQKYPFPNVTTICADYTRYDFPHARYTLAIAFQTLHHLLPKRKQLLFGKIFSALKAGGAFYYVDYLACCEEEELLLRQTYLRKRKRQNLPEDAIVHFDLPLTVPHEIALLQSVGFEASAQALPDAVLIRAVKPFDTNYTDIPS